MDERDELIARLTRFYREARNEVPSTPPPWTPRERARVRWLQPVLASAAIVAVAAGLAVTLRMVRDHAAARPSIAATPTVTAVPSPSASPSPSPSVGANWVTRQVPVGQVTAMSLDSAAVFALYAPTPASGGIDPSQIRLARVDRATAAVVTAGPFPNAWRMTRTGAGLWLAAGSEAWAPKADTQWLTLVDPVTLTVKLRVRLPGQADTGQPSDPQLAGTSNLMWLAYGHSLYRLDPSTGRVLLTKALSGTATGLSLDASGQRLYLGLNSTSNQGAEALVTEWDASTGGSLGSASTGGAGLGGPMVAAASDGVWVAYATGMQGQIEHRNASALSLLATPPQQHSNGIRVAVGGGAVWLVDSGAQQLACADPSSGAVAASSPETLPAVVVADATGTYLGDSDGVAFLQPPASCPH
jgi:hypothetical protein